jgi:SAM-dependent methyltransferase
MKQHAYNEMAATEDNHWWYSGRRTIIRSILKLLHMPSDAHILEIGAGTGGNLRMLSQFGQVEAIEKNDYALTVALSKTGHAIAVKSGELPNNLPCEPQSYDLVCLFDVLEHIEKDLESLIAASKTLKANGMLLVTVPAFQWLWSQHDINLHHKRRYSADDIRKLADQANLKISKLSYFNVLLFPVALASRILSRIIDKDELIGTSEPPRYVNSLLKSIFGCEALILKHINFPFGLSIIAVLSHR